MGSGSLSAVTRSGRPARDSSRWAAGAVQAVGLYVRKGLAFDRCLRSVDAERNRGPKVSRVILFAPCLPVARHAGTALALFLSSVEPLARLLRTPVLVSRNCCDP